MLAATTGISFRAAQVSAIRTLSQDTTPAKLDLENGLLIQDNYAKLTDKFEDEVSRILEHTHLICTYKQLEKVEDYPIGVQRLVRKITRLKADGVLKRIL